MIGDKIDTAKLESVLTQHAGLGWRLKSVTSASVAGRVGPGGVTGLVLIFERRVRVPSSPTSAPPPPADVLPS
jgi:hypothetical protein